MNKRITLTCLSAMLLLFAGGCWDHHPPETSALVHMVGIDINPKDTSEMTVTQSVALPNAVMTGGASGNNMPDGTPFVLLSSVGRSVEEAQFGSVSHLSRLPRLEHMVALVLGEDFARTDVSHTISWVLRNPQARPGVWLLVSEGTAQRFLDAMPALDPLPGAAVRGLLRTSDRIPVTRSVKVYEFAQALLSPRRDAFAPLVRRVDSLLSPAPTNLVPRPFAGFGPADQPRDTEIEMIGLALFKDNRMVGTLTGSDALGVVWISGIAKVPVTVPHPVREDAFMTALAVNSSTKNTVEIRDGQLILGIRVKTAMDLWEVGMLEPVAVGKFDEIIVEAFQTGIKEHIEATMKKTQSLQVDVFGFAEELYRRSPQTWKHIAGEWREMYENATLDIHVDVHLRRSGVNR